uniref:Uncharacterized protein n=1 Tax=Trieres chinensis TaxID=1514140 RepID=A0A7S2EY28_TRICV|mmetsp:Transcript_8271/g.17511  ORF Transcript_8271/g.17511 Transcript_8271/m.17511 type:complete len:199 (+) Transcript_8271:55-651(+)|eukprot:CAMPEP_0183308060 /NCGR_PEP_ID=MMETSP0160_2-20130417/19720_1 /TAXON_ID=2839 ORGANISM="Odontella Sinensis, Strain Grunow 1884" /NCGR_SAMPLE_ID=MMETSP0160_2 /ASSEMBLY_ACC=CAM_ASM_000250 /LENGTH=198 /DNA_ID=CAMNT_0025471805 /DNA_START=36 /DNA_END=632 /DNA_ORIENTATION=+
MTKAAAVTNAGNRKAKRKEERLAKKRRRTEHSARAHHNVEGLAPPKERAVELANEVSSPSRTEAKTARPTTHCSTASAQNSTHRKEESRDKYAHLDAETAAAMRADDAEIEALEEKLGLRVGKEKDRLRKEYSKLEGFGDDFCAFLDGVDGIVERCMGTGSEGGGYPTPEDRASGEDEIGGYFDGTRLILDGTKPESE